MLNKARNPYSSDAQMIAYEILQNHNEVSTLGSRVGILTVGETRLYDAFIEALEQAYKKGLHDGLYNVIINGAIDPDPMTSIKFLKEKIHAKINSATT